MDSELHTDESYSGMPVELDGRHFVRCRFENCELRYGGGPMPLFERCSFVRPGFHFYGAAENVIATLRMLHAFSMLNAATLVTQGPGGAQHGTNTIQ